MKAVIDLLALFVGVVLAIIIQNAMPLMADLHGAHVMLVPMVFCYAAMVLPFEAMLVAALYSGFLCDLMYLHVVSGKVEIPIGCSILFFVIFGCLANGFQPAMANKNAWPFVLLSGVFTSAYLLMQFVMITISRGGFFWVETVAWRILAPGAMAVLFAPLFYWTVSHIDRLLPDGSRKKRSIN